MASPSCAGCLCSRLVPPFLAQEQLLHRELKSLQQLQLPWDMKHLVRGWEGGQTWGLAARWSLILGLCKALFVNCWGQEEHLSGVFLLHVGCQVPLQLRPPAEGLLEHRVPEDLLPALHVILWFMLREFLLLKITPCTLEALEGILPSVFPVVDF